MVHKVANNKEMSCLLVVVAQEQQPSLRSLRRDGDDVERMVEAMMVNNTLQYTSCKRYTLNHQHWTAIGEPAAFGRVRSW